MLEFRRNGRTVSAQGFVEGLEQDVIEAALLEFEKRVHRIASSIVDPETGKHADIFVRRKGKEGLILRTSGSAVYARELERRLGAETGSIESTDNQALETPRVYLAHASEDKDSFARPLACHLIENGIDVWFDEWEIRAGDSLRRKMEEGLHNCTHFIVVLTPASINKPWVQTEIDTGFMKAIDGRARFIGVRIGVPVVELSPFLRTLSCPEISLGSHDNIVKLIADIYGVSRKPALGTSPKYVQPAADELKTWSSSAIAVAKYLVCNSEFGHKFDPQVTLTCVAAATGLPEDDVSLGVLDLEDCGLIQRDQCIGAPENFWPTNALFVEFDKHFLGFDNKIDAISVATWLVNEKINGIETEELAKHFPDWAPRRLNSALNYLEGAGHVKAYVFLGTSQLWTMSELHVTERTRKFVRDNS